LHLSEVPIYLTFQGHPRSKVKVKSKLYASVG
jgi:hypothetical protein